MNEYLKRLRIAGDVSRDLRDDLEGLMIVGSVAYGGATAKSDLDLIGITSFSHGGLGRIGDMVD